MNFEAFRFNSSLNDIVKHTKFCNGNIFKYKFTGFNAVSSEKTFTCRIRLFNVRFDKYFLNSILVAEKRKKPFISDLSLDCGWVLYILGHLRHYH